MIFTMDRRRLCSGPQIWQVVYALRGKENVEWGNPYSVGMTGLIGVS